MPDEMPKFKCVSCKVNPIEPPHVLCDTCINIAATLKHLDKVNSHLTMLVEDLAATEKNGKIPAEAQSFVRKYAPVITEIGKKMGFVSTYFSVAFLTAVSECKTEEDLEKKTNIKF